MCAGFESWPDRKLTPVEVVMRIGAKYQRRRAYGFQVQPGDHRGSGRYRGGHQQQDRRLGPRSRTTGSCKTTETPNLSDVIKSSQGTIEQLNVILAKVDNLADSLNSTKGSIGELINNPELYNKAVATVNQLSKLVDAVANGKGSIGKLFPMTAMYNHINDTVSKLDRIATDLDEGKGTIGKLLKDETLANNLNQSVSNANQLIAGINAGKGGLGMIAKDPQFAAKLRDTVDSSDSVLNSVDSGRERSDNWCSNPRLQQPDQMLTETRELCRQFAKTPRSTLPST